MLGIVLGVGELVTDKIIDIIGVLQNLIGFRELRIFYLEVFEGWRIVRVVCENKRRGIWCSGFRKMRMGSFVFLQILECLEGDLVVFMVLGEVKSKSYRIVLLVRRSDVLFKEGWDGVFGWVEGKFSRLFLRGFWVMDLYRLKLSSVFGKQRLLLVIGQIEVRFFIF